MKLFYFYNSSDNILKLKDQFEKSIPGDLQPYPIIVDNHFCQEYHGGAYYGWHCKYKTILTGFHNTKQDEYFIFSDIDIKFYSTITDKIDYHKDIYFQQETPTHSDINIGFMIIKNCKRNIDFWNYANKIIEECKYISSNNCYKIAHKKGSGSGQFIINDLLKDTFNLYWDRLPLNFWSKSIGIEYLSKNIIIHHANALYGAKQKLEHLQYISQLVGRL